MKKTTTFDELGRWFDRLPEASQRCVLDAAAAGVRSALENHFRRRQGEPRKDGFPPTGFWVNTNGNSVLERMGDTTFTKNSAVITIQSAPLAHKLNPSPPPIKPKGHKYLTIPAIAAASRMPARDFIGLKFAIVSQDGGKWEKGQKGRPALVRGESHEVVFFLVRQAKTPHDPRALPPDDSLAEAARSAANQALDIVLEG